MKILLRLPMTKEEKKAKGKEEEEVPEGFIDAVNEFYESSDIIFKCFDDIYSSYLRGGDIREDLKGFINVKSNVFRLIYEILGGEEIGEEIGEKLENKGITKEKRDKIVEFRERYSALANEVVLTRLEEDRGFFNVPTGVLPKFTFDEDISVPVIELKVFSGRKEIMYLKGPTMIVYNRIIKLLQRIVKDCLDEMKDKHIAPFEIEGIKEAASDVQKDTKEILDIIGEIEKKRKK